MDIEFILKKLAEEKKAQQERKGKDSHTEELDRQDEYTAQFNAEIARRIKEIEDSLRKGA